MELTSDPQTLPNLKNLRKALKAASDPTKIATYAWFFKTGPGQYGEGDRFMGITVPEQRKIARKYQRLPLSDLKKLLISPLHEERLVALFILRHQFEKAKTESQQKRIVDFYLENRAGVNNWDLVDSSAPYLLGEYLCDRDKKILYELVESKNLWDRRIAILSTYAFIKKNRFEDALKLNEKLLHDSQNLLQKAVGWMLREIGNRDLESEENFLKKHYRHMPRTMLRYAIEKFPEPKRKAYLKGTI